MISNEGHPTKPRNLTGVLMCACLLVGCANSASDRLDSGSDGAIVDAADDSVDARSDAGPVCSPCENCSACENYWICGGSATRIDLKQEADGCYLMGLPGRKLLAPDGSITEDGAVIGHADGTGARVTVLDTNGAQWLFCAGGWTCRTDL